MRRFMSSVLLACVFALPVHFVQAQCTEWSHDFALSGFDGGVRAYATFDDGHGQALFVGGEFRHVGELATRSIVRWDGALWSRVGGDFDGAVNALCAFDDGSGAALYAAGSFGSVQTDAGPLACPGLARWNGSGWTSVAAGPTGGVISALCVYDHGAGAELYLGGSFQLPAGPASLARLGTAGWEILSAPPGYVFALGPFDDGSGGRLAVGGDFTQLNGVPANRIALFDGAAFAALGAGLPSAVRTLCSFDDGSGPALAVSGFFGTAGGTPATNIAAWRNGSWSALGAGLDQPARSLVAFDDGTGARLHAAGSFLQSGVTPLEWLARWNGTGWTALGAPGDVDRHDPLLEPALAVHDDGTGAQLYVGTSVRIGPARWTHGMGRWDGQQFHAVGSPRNHTLDNAATEFAVCDLGSGRRLVACGPFQYVGGLAARQIAAWTGSDWEPLGPGLFGNALNEPASVDHGSGPRLYVSTFDTGSTLYSWNGVAWSTIADSKLGGQYTAECAYDDGTGAALYVGGRFPSIGGVAAQGIARYDGSAFHPVGGGLQGSSLAPGVPALRVLDLGNGPVLVAGGTFTSAGGVPAQHVAVWNGASWSALGAGLASVPIDFAVIDHGAGPVLYAACTPGPLGTLASFDGTSWSSVPQGPDGTVSALAVFDDGTGAQLVVGGSYTHAGGAAFTGLARWNGQQWSALGGDLAAASGAPWVLALRVFDDGQGGGPDLYIGGNLQESGGVLSPFLAKWNGCLGPIGTFCHGDGSAIPCPCGNDGAPGHGCANSSDAAGARLGWSGDTNPDTLMLHSSGQAVGTLAVFVQGDALLAHAPFGDGLRCVSGTLRRLYVRTAVGGTASAPATGEPSIRDRANSLGDTVAPGCTRYYQVYFRDLQSAYCPARLGNRFNITNGVVVHW